MSSRGVTVAYLNALLGTTAEYPRYTPQIERYKHIAQKLIEIDRELGVVSLSEVELHNGDVHIGDNIAKLTGHGSGMWRPHARWDTEHIGMFGAQVDRVEFMDIGEGRYAAMTTLSSGIIVVGVHLKHGLNTSGARRDQLQKILDAIGSKPAVLMGDWNEIEMIGKARRLLKRSGFRSVFHVLGRQRPPTVPAAEYVSQLNSLHHLVVKVTGGFNIDDIYVRDVAVLDAGVFDTKSDHRGVWATIDT